MTKFQKSPKCKKWWNGLSAEGAKANVRSALHSADDPPFFVFLSFSCIFFCCGSICSMGSMGSSKATARCYTSICDGIIRLCLFSNVCSKHLYKRKQKCKLSLSQTAVKKKHENTLVSLDQNILGENLFQNLWE